MIFDKTSLSVGAAILLLAVSAPLGASANTSGDVTFDLDPTNVPSCATALTLPNGTVSSSIADTDTWTGNYTLPDNSTAPNLEVWAAYFISSEFDIEWHINNCWGPSYGGWLVDGGVSVTKTLTANSTTSTLPDSVQGASDVANASQVWVNDDDTMVKIGDSNQWTNLSDLHPYSNSTSPTSDNVYRTRVELELIANYQQFLTDSSYVATATYELWED